MIADRRQLLRLAASAALLPVLAPRALQAQPASRFAPPNVRMGFTRELRREMAGGAAFVVTRAFSIRFVPAADGFRVEGEQVDVHVDAPEKLAAFAELERQRRETGMFPLTLDPHGLIHGAGGAIDKDQLDAAVRVAMATFARDGASSTVLAEHERFISALHQTASQLVTELPKDLFAPVDPDRTARREVALPDGAQGEVTVRFTALADPATGLMEQAKREVLTDLSGNQRRTVESWQLGAL